MVAECYRDWGCEWRIAPSFAAQPRVVWDHEQQNNSGNGGYVIRPGREPQRFESGDPYGSWCSNELRTEIVLPTGLAWSWEKLECPHSAPDEHCQCGIYAVNKPKQAEHYGYPGRVLVKVAVWGRTVVGSDGVRGEFAYPLELIDSNGVGDDWLDRVRERYRLDEQKPAPTQVSEDTGWAAKELQTMERETKKRRLW